MSKISNTSAYPTIAPADGDLLIGTDINDSNATKTFTIGSVVALTPADTLAEVLTAGNTATNNIVLTGDISCTNLTGTTSITTPLIIPTNIQDAAGNTGTVGQHLVKNAANALEWGAGSADTLANVLAAGNSAANGITLTGATGIIASTVSVPTDIRDNAGNLGTAGQTLKKSAANALAWETVGDNTLAEVLAAGNTATNNIVLTGDIACTNLSSTLVVSANTVEATVSVTPQDIVDNASATGTAGQYLRKSAANALAWETVTSTTPTLSDVLAAGNSAANGISLTGATGGIAINTQAEIGGTTPLKLTSIAAHRDNADAVASGLVAGDVYQTDGTGVAPLNVAGILMVTQ
jgi:hypothetical protein